MPQDPAAEVRDALFLRAVFASPNRDNGDSDDQHEHPEQDCAGNADRTQNPHQAPPAQEYQQFHFILQSS